MACSSALHSSPRCTFECVDVYRPSGAQILAPKDDDPQPLTEEEIAGAVGPKAMLTWHSDGASQLRMLPMLHTLCCCCSVGRAHPHSRPAATARSCPAAERDTLLQQGFSNWMRRDFNAFVRAVS